MSSDVALPASAGLTLPMHTHTPRVVGFTRADRVEFRPTEWLIEGWLVKNTLAGLVGPPAAGKSFLAIDWACRVATARPWFGGKTHKGAVFYMAGEGRQGLRKRIAAWETHFQTPINGAPLYLADGLPFLCEPSQAFGAIDAIEELADELLFECGAVEPSLVVIDTVARAMAGQNENSAEAMGALVRSMDWLRERWGATVLAVHHTGHESADRARGSSAFRAALDSEFLIRPNDPELELRATKAKDWRLPSSLRLRKLPVAVELPAPDGTLIQDSSLVLQAAVEANVADYHRAQVVRLRQEGESLRDIAKALGIGKTTVERYLREAGE